MLAHRHLIIRAEVKNPIRDEETAKDWMTRLIKDIGMEITENGGPYADYVKKEGNCGIAAVAIIETSHVGLHIWDQENPPIAQIDVYSCSEFAVRDILPYVNEMMPTKIWYKFLDRENCLQEIDNSYRDLTIDDDERPHWTTCV